VKVQETLDSLLEEHQALDLNDYNVTHNHAPMVLIALYRLGADSTQLRHYYHNLKIDTAWLNISEFKTDPKQLDINVNNWKENLGRSKAASSYCEFFISEINQHGAQQVLSQYVPALMRGVAAHAFHPLLRLGYGIDLDNEKEIACGLGYWAATYLPMPEVAGNQDELSPEEFANQIVNSPVLRNIKMNSRSIAERINQIYSCKEFCELLHPIIIEDENPLDEISQLLANAFVENHHFSLLHGVTSCHALRLVLPYCDNIKQIINQYWYSVCALHLTVLNLDSDFSSPLPDEDQAWLIIFKRAIDSNIEHTIKFIYTCHQESEEYDRKIYKQLALRELEKTSPFA
jgi:Questin oxidase-like